MTALRGILWRAAGPSALSWPVFWVLFVVTLIGYLMDAVPVLTWGTVPLRLAMVAVAATITFGAMVLARRVLLHGAGDERRPWRMLLVFVVGGIVRGMALGVGAAYVLGDDPRYVFRVVSGITVLATLLVVAAALVDAAHAEAARRSELEAARLRLRQAETHAEEEIDAAHAALVERIRVALDGAVGGDGTEAGGEAALRLRHGIETIVRPLSHELSASVPTWASNALITVEPTTRWRDVWREMTLWQPFQPGASVLVAFIVGLPFLLYRAGAIAGVAATCILLLGLLLGLGLARAVVAPVLHRMSGPLARLLVFLVTSLAILAAIALATGVLSAGAGRDPRPTSLALVAIGIVFLVLTACAQSLFAGIRVVEADLVAATRTLESTLARVHTVAWQRQRMLALAIHGPLQARITAVVLRLEQAVSADAEPDAALAEARAAVLRAIAEIEGDLGDAGDVRRDLAEIAEAWEGVCAVEILLDDGLAARIDADSACAVALVDVCTEACSNAVRHANATAIEIGLDDDASGLRLRVTSDGIPLREGPEGLGSRLLDEVAIRWTRRLGDGRTELDVLLPSPAVAQPGAVA